jgi:curved DNA-binding protein CbpA
MNRWELYKTLEVPFGASSDQLKAAYRKLAKKYHPDLTKNTQSGDKLSKVIEAYKILSVDAPARENGASARPAQRKSPRSPNGHSYGKQEEEPNSTDIFALGKLLESAKTSGMRAYAARCLGKSGKKSAYAFLRKALSDISPIVVKTAVEAVGNLKIQQSAGELGLVFTKGNSEIKEAVLRAIKKIGAGERFRGIIDAAEKDENKMIRKYARELFPA